MTNKFYTYLHMRNDTGKVFYIGKGKGRRANQHHGRNDHWRRIVAKHGYTVEIAAYWTNETDAFSHERALIAGFRGMGIQLVNLTDGGEGMAGHTHTAETIAKISAANKGKPKSPSAVEKSRLSNTGRKATEAMRIKRLLDTSRSGGKHSEVALEKMRLARSSPEERARMSIASKAALSDPTVVKRMLASRLVSKTYRQARMKPVTCIDSGVTYTSAKDAASKLGAIATNITAVCKGRVKSAKGLRFCYAPADWLKKINPPPLPDKVKAKDLEHTHEPS